MSDNIRKALEKSKLSFEIVDDVYMVSFEDNIKCLLNEENGKFIRIFVPVAKGFEIEREEDLEHLYKYVNEKNNKLLYGSLTVKQFDDDDGAFAVVSYRHIFPLKKNLIGNAIEVIRYYVNYVPFMVGRTLSDFEETFFEDVAKV